MQDHVMLMAYYYPIFLISHKLNNNQNEADKPIIWGVRNQKSNKKELSL